MKNVILLLTFAITVLGIFSCQKEEAEAAKSPQLAAEQERYTEPIPLGQLTERSSCPWTVLPAGSVDALAAAIASTCDHGVVYLQAGMHTENQPITITKPVKIIGAGGAILEIKSNLALLDTATLTGPLNPALHFLDAPGSLVQDLEIRPLDGNGGAAILLQNSHGSGVMRCNISNFQFAVVLEKSDQVAIMFNTIVGTSLWQTGEVADCYSIMCMNGKSAYVTDNKVSNSLFGIWACDEWGTLERNETFGNYIGTIVCNVPAGYILPSGELTGSLVPGTGWKVRNNNSHDNFNIGYIVIDGANNNLLENNNAFNNGSYDIELTTDTYRFGFLTPAAYKNTVIAGAYPNITIKDCGNGNTVIGGVQVDTGSDPCN